MKCLDSCRGETISLFRKQIPIRSYGCKNSDLKEVYKYEPNHVNLFIQLENRCNANCSFCEYHGNKVDFDFKKLEVVINEIEQVTQLGKLNITGGEPTLDLSKFDEMMLLVKEQVLDKGYTPEVTLNTNGVYLNDMLKYEDILDSIGLSHHHYNDNLNYEIFGTKNVANNSDIKDFQNNVKNKHLVQLRCNAIKGYIDNVYELKNYLDTAISLNCYDCGFVTLMPLNDYCVEHQINFDNLLNSDILNILKIREYTRYECGESVCLCNNYVYNDSHGNFCKFYRRLFCTCDLVAGQLVYDGQNLRLGFGGDVIY